MRCWRLYRPAKTPAVVSCVPGHVTASALVLDNSGGRVLLTLHPRLAGGAIGGHCEDEDDDLVAAALREATEESGSAACGWTSELVAVHVHPLTCSLGVPTRHLDLQFVPVHPPRRRSPSATNPTTCAGGPPTRYRPVPITRWPTSSPARRPRERETGRTLDVQREAGRTLGGEPRREKA